MKFPHVMLDLETMSSDPTAAVIQIGAVPFSLEDIGPGFKTTIDLEDSMRYGTVSGPTIKWWMEQADAARKSVMSGTRTLRQGLQDFGDWMRGLEGGGHKVWAHATFDHPILLNAYSKSNLIRPFHYRQCRDLRTLEEFWGGGIEWPSRKNVHHDALDDAIFQAEAARLMLRKAWGK